VLIVRMEKSRGSVSCGFALWMSVDVVGHDLKPPNANTQYCYKLSAKYVLESAAFFGIVARVREGIKTLCNMVECN
jgi:hypothetical protein